MGIGSICLLLTSCPPWEGVGRERTKLIASQKNKDDNNSLVQGFMFAGRGLPSASGKQFLGGLATVVSLPLNFFLISFAPIRLNSILPRRVGRSQKALHRANGVSSDFS